MDCLLKELSSKKTMDIRSEDMTEFIESHKKLNEILDFKTELRRIIVASFMINLIVEGLPQLIVMLSLLVTELGNEHGFGKLRSIFENVLLEYIGLPGNVSFIVMFCLQGSKIILSLKVVVSSETYGIGSGMIALLIKMLELIIMVPAKIVLLTLQLYQAPFVFALVTTAEFAIAYVYCMISQEHFSLTRDVVPITLSPVLYMLTKGNVLTHSERILKKSFTCLARFNGALNVVLLHILNLLLVYIPTKLILPEVLPNVDENWETGYLCTLGAYVGSLIPFLCLEFTFFKFGRRWKILQRTC